MESDRPTSQASRVDQNQDGDRVAARDSGESGGGITEDIRALTKAADNLQKERYKRKYLALRRRCQQLQESNDRLIHRVHVVKRCVTTLNRQRRMLKDKLESYHDDYKRMAIKQTLMELEGDDSSDDSNDQGLIYDNRGVEGSSEVGSNKERATMGSSGATSTSTPPTSQPAAGNVFLLYCQKHRQRIHTEWLREKAEVSEAELTRYMANLWKQMPLHEKQRYYDEFNDLKRKYDEQQVE